MTRQCPDYHYPYIGRRFVINLPEIKLSAADYAWDQHEPLRTCRVPHPEPARSNANHVGGNTLWALMAAAQESVVDVHKPLVDYLVTLWVQTRDPDIRQRLVSAGYEHRIDAIEISELERRA